MRVEELIEKLKEFDRQDETNITEVKIIKEQGVRKAILI